MDYTFSTIVLIRLFLPIAREGNVFTGVCLSTIGLMPTGSLHGLVMARSVRIVLEFFLIYQFDDADYGKKTPHT